MRILILNGPNLNMLGRRKPGIYGTRTLEDILDNLRQRADNHGVELSSFQSNHEGALIDYLQAEAADADGVIINPGGLTHYGLALRDALEECERPVIEIHISNIYRREPFRHSSVIAEVALGQISGLGWRGYVAALDTLVDILREQQDGGRRQ